MQATSTGVYLRADPHVLASRVGRGPARPWVDGDATAVLTDMFRRRDPVLRAIAQLTVEADQPIDRILAQIEAMAQDPDPAPRAAPATPGPADPAGSGSPAPAR